MDVCCQWPNIQFVQFVNNVTYPHTGWKKIVGAVLGSHDGRIGFINHLAVMKPYRKKGIARLLVENVIRALKSEGMLKIAIFVLKNNADAKTFWRRMGFAHEDIVELHSIVV